MSDYVSTYSTNDDIQAHYPFTFSDTSRPRLEDVESYRLQIKDMIDVRLAGSAASTTGLKHLEVEKVCLLIDNYHARSRGEPTVAVIITENDITTIRISDSESGWGYGGGHYSVDIP